MISACGLFSLKLCSITLSQIGQRFWKVNNDSSRSRGINRLNARIQAIYRMKELRLILRSTYVLCLQSPPARDLVTTFGRTSLSEVSDSRPSSPRKDRK